jgi:hypothetical protein
MGSTAYTRTCVPPPGAPPDVCPEVHADALGGTIAGRLKELGIEINGIGAGVCDQANGLDYTTWNYSVGIMDWKDADAAVAVVDEVLRTWGVGQYFGVSVRGIDCTNSIVAN